jgi:uncharacterized repeat protein (TIGR02543 family)
MISLETVFSEDSTVYAHWTRTISFTITFDGNGGTPATVTLSTGADGKLPRLASAPTRSGYDFAGWYTASSGGSRISVSTVFTQDTTVYAHWSAIPTYTVTFDGNGGTPAKVQMVTGTDGKLSRLADAPARSGYDFVGWFDSVSGGSMISASKVFSQDTTVYAHWTSSAVTYTVTFDGNGGAPATVQMVTGTDGKLFRLADAPARSGYDFTGWFDSVSGGSRITVSTVFTQDTTVYAHWTSSTVTYTVTFDSNGGSPATVQLVTGTDGKLPRLAGAPSRSGYDFAGWFSEPNGGSRITLSTIFSEDTTVYAHWNTVRSYYITLDGNGGSPTSTIILTDTDGTIPDFPYTPTKVGYGFSGWYTSPDGGSQVTRSTVFHEDTTVYAHWELDDGSSSLFDLDPKVLIIVVVLVLAIAAAIGFALIRKRSNS